MQGRKSVLRLEIEMADAFVFRGRLHTLVDGNVWVFLGESIIDRVATLSALRIKVEITESSWAKCLTEDYLERVAVGRLAALRRNHGASGPW